MSSATKYDTDKVDITLLEPLFLQGMASVMMMGAKKYGRDNWRKGLNYNRTIAAIYRHLMTFQMGEDTDKESGLSHLYHLAVNLMFLEYFQRKGVGVDDRQGKRQLTETAANLVEILNKAQAGN